MLENIKQLLCLGLCTFRQKYPFIYLSVLSDSTECLTVAARARVQNLTLHWPLVSSEERKILSLSQRHSAEVLLRQCQLSSCSGAAYSWQYGFKTRPPLVWQYFPLALEKFCIYVQGFRFQKMASKCTKIYLRPEFLFELSSEHPSFHRQNTTRV